MSTDPEALRAVVIGALNVDLKCLPDGPLSAGTSTPGRVRLSAGGVARNIAHNLAGHGVEVHMAGRVGRDGLAADLLGRTIAAGVDVGLVAPWDGATDAYVALIDGAGELIGAVVESGAVESIDPSDIDVLAELITTADLVVLDCNLTGAALGRALRLGAAGRARVCVDCVSVEKATRLSEALEGGARVDLVWCNRAELGTLTGLPVGDADELTRAAAHLVAGGVGALLVGLGADGAVVATDSGCTPIPAAGGPVRDVTGAGDAAVAATLAALGRGADLLTAARVGQEASARAIGTLETVAEGGPPSGGGRL